MLPAPSAGTGSDSSSLGSSSSGSQAGGAALTHLQEHQECELCGDGWGGGSTSPGTPPFQEAFHNCPLLYLSLAGYDRICQSLDVQESIIWAQRLHGAIDDILPLHLEFIRATPFTHSGSYAFTTSPDTPADEQALAMWEAGHELLRLLPLLRDPLGHALQPKLSLHAGHFAGGVIGSTAYSYDLFGSAVTVVVGMNHYARPHQMLVSAEALLLLPPKLRQGLRICGTLSLGPESAPLQVYCLEDWQERPNTEGLLQSPRGGVCAAQGGWWRLLLPTWLSRPARTTPRRHSEEPRLAAQPYTTFTPLRPPPSRRRQRQQPPQPLSKALSPPPAVPGAALSSGLLRLRLQFADRGLESSYCDAHNASLASLDVLFGALQSLISALCLGAASRWSQVEPAILMTCASLWMVPLASALATIINRRHYLNVREPLWALHRVLVVAMLCCHALLGAGRDGGGGADSGGGSQRQLVQLGTLAMLVDALCFKVRFLHHLLITGINLMLAAGAMGALAVGGRLKLTPADLLLRVLMGVLLPSVIVYAWEAEQRATFLARGPLPEACGGGGEARRAPAKECGGGSGAAGSGGVKDIDGASVGAKVGASVGGGTAREPAPEPKPAWPSRRRLASEVQLQQEVG